MEKHPANLEEIGPLYAKLMEEIKRRVAIVYQIGNGSHSLPQMAAFELCYVQLRKICEVFALACLVAHGELPDLRKKLVQKTYQADHIIKMLSTLHPRFYPVPGEQRLDLDTPKPVEVINLESGFLTKDDLVSLYGECGKYLHRGSIRQLLTNWEPAPDFEKIRSWVDKIIKLLSHHQIETIQSDTQLWVIMQGKDDGRVHWFVMKKIGPVKK